MAQEFIREGASIVICARDRDLLEQTRAELEQEASPGQKVLAKTCDVSSVEQVAELVEFALGNLVRLTDTLAEELKPFRIHINAVAPGALNTRLLDECIEAGPEKVRPIFFERALQQKKNGGVPLEKGARLYAYLASPQGDGITGRLVSAQWDPWSTLHERKEELGRTDIHLRRIIPEDRGPNWA